MKNKAQSNRSTNHFENDFGAYLPLNNANASFLISFLISLFFKTTDYRQ